MYDLSQHDDFAQCTGLADQSTLQQAVRPCKMIFQGSICWLGQRIVTQGGAQLVRHSRNPTVEYLQHDGC
jgi:hypothetical protein